ncbi:type II secretion system F family protein [Patescibacteria group bacterium]|nr:type II secretion system F family protein [Patescibacteria group bacterium]
MKFDYRARNNKGEILEGKIDAPSDEVAADVLMERGLSIISLEAIIKPSYGKRLQLRVPFFDRVKKKDIVIFARQLAVMTSANLPVVQSLHIITQQTENEALKSKIEEIANEVESGVKLSAALAKYPKTFSYFFISMVKSGETSGKLDEVLNYLANQEEEDYDMVAKIKGAMIYPAFIVGGLIIVGTAMMIFVIPQLTSMLTASGAELPLTTRILIGTSNVFKNYWWLLLLILIGLIGIFRWFVNSESGRRIWDLLKIRIPIFGTLFQKIYLVRFTHSLATLVVGGIPLVAALRIVSDVVGNDAYRRLIDKTVKEVEDGNSIGTVFLRSEIVPKMVSHMMAVGEKTGRLDDILRKLSSFYSREVSNMVANLTHTLEPIIMVLIGIGVGGMVSAIIMPMYQLANAF